MGKISWLHFVNLGLAAAGAVVGIAIQKKQLDETVTKRLAEIMANQPSA